MGIRTTVEITCDYKDCTLNNSGPVRVGWCVEDINSGVPLPEGAATIVTLDLGGKKFAFCSRLHASYFFLPDMYEIKQKGLVEFPKEKWAGPELSNNPEETSGWKPGDATIFSEEHPDNGPEKA